ncbi:MAG: hypothetical protein NTV98_03110 [Candidatus Roizmanbacteria bacterium]|nr:hypothetical protein [Candidatus Roizmanbacteria bacterium]
MINKNKVIPVLAVTLIVGSLFMVSKPAYAASKGMGGGNFFSDLITFISQKFGIDKTQVQNAVQDFKKQKQASITPRPTMSPQQQQDAEKKRLDPLVTQGKISQDQENAIIAELTTLRATYKINQSETPELRKTQMTKMQDELKKWASDNKIDPQYVLSFGRGRGMGEGKIEGGFRGRGPMSTTTP